MTYTVKQVKKITESFSVRLSFLLGGIPFVDEGRAQVQYFSCPNHREEILCELLDIRSAAHVLTKKQRQVFFMRLQGMELEEIREAMDWRWTDSVVNCLDRIYKKIALRLSGP